MIIWTILIQVGWNNIPESCVIRPITHASLIRRRKHMLFASSLPAVFLPAENSTFAFMKRNHMFFTSPHLIPIILFPPFSANLSLQVVSNEHYIPPLSLSILSKRIITTSILSSSATICQKMVSRRTDNIEWFMKGYIFWRGLVLNNDPLPLPKASKRIMMIYHMSWIHKTSKIFSYHHFLEGCVHT